MTTDRAEFLRWYGFCPKCRRVVLPPPLWRRAVGSEAGNALGLVPAFDIGASDPLPRDRPAVFEMLRSLFPRSNPRRDVFARCYGPRHDCSAPTVPDPEAKPRGRLDEVYDTV
jgi:hypothetical protein